MMTLRQFANEPSTIPTATSWYLADLGEARGKQELFTRQAPQKLKVLRENALIESAVSSNRIEGVEVDRSRIGTLIFGAPALRSRDEEEIAGYRNALRSIHENTAKLPIAEPTILQFHRLCRGDIWDAGKYKEKDVDIIQRYPDGRSRVRFRTLPATQTPAAMAEIFELWSQGLTERWVHPLILMGALNFDFLCIHPFRDGNGRVSRLLLLLSCYHCGFEVGRYISLERLIEQHKERYYETLELASQGWHEGRHDPWVYINFLLFIVLQATREFEKRLGETSTPKGEKTDAVVAAINAKTGPFSVAELQQDCPAVSLDMIRRVLRQLRAEAKVECIGRGRHAKWRKIGN